MIHRMPVYRGELAELLLEPIESSLRGWRNENLVDGVNARARGISIGHVMGARYHA